MKSRHRYWSPGPCLVLFCLLLGGFPPARAEGAPRSRIVLLEARLDGRSVSTAGEIRIPAAGRLSLSVACEPPTRDALYRLEVEGISGWSPYQTDPTLPVPSARPGLYTVLITARSSQGDWLADTLGLNLRVEPSTQDAPGLPGRPSHAGRLLVFALALALAAILLWLVARRGSRWSSHTSKGAAPMRSPGSDQGDRTGAVAGRQSAASHRRGFLGLGTGGRVQELERELALLRGRLEELQSTRSDLERLNLELREKCEFLERANSELKDLQRRKAESLATIAHDIKNPAAAIQALAELLQSYDLNAQQQQQFVADILETSTRILNLTQDLSRVMVTEARELPIHLAPGSLRPLLVRVCRTNQAVADRKKIAIRTRIPETLPEIDMDPARLEEVFDNLLSNAIKYSRANTAVTVEASVGPAKITIDVIDQGIGFSAADLQDAFQMGRTLSAKPTGGESSSGLGLWIVRKIVEGHRGLVTVKSVPGSGTTFTVTLPIRRPGGR